VVIVNVLVYGVLSVLLVLLIVYFLDSVAIIGSKFFSVIFIALNVVHCNCCIMLTLLLHVDVGL